MKKLIATTLAIVASGVAFALPIDNPASASLYRNGLYRGESFIPRTCSDSCWSWMEKFSFRVGFYGDYVYNRNLQIDHPTYSTYIKDTEISTNAGYLALNFCDWIDVFATVGATDITISADSFPFFSGVAGPYCTINFEPTFSWSVGARVTAWQYGGFILGVEGQYFRTQPNITSFDFYGPAVPTPIYFNSNNQTHYDEWQVGLGASYVFTMGCPGVSFVPYMGVKWAGGHFGIDNFTTLVDGAPFTVPSLEPGKLWGYAVGLTAVVNSAVGVTVEGRFADEKAVYVNGQFRF